MNAFLVLAQTIADLADPALFAEALRPDAAHLRRSAQAAVPRPGYVATQSLDHAGNLASALALAPDAPIIPALRDAGAQLVWHYGYKPRPGEADLSNRIAFAELIGPDGPLFAPDCRVGFTLMARETFYPMHAHPAIELYRVISGQAEWTTPQSSRLVPPGESVLHPTNMPHAMRTLAEPLLALYGWRGDIDTPPRYL